MLELALVVIMFVAFGASFWWNARRFRQDDSPRRLQEKFRRIFYFSMPVIATLAAVQVYSGAPRPWWFFLCWAVFLVSMGYQAFRKPSAKDHLRNFIQDPRHCGQCGYDLTGNTSGTCPECGWSIPQASAPIERPRWVFWWNGWQIDYLDDWRKSLANMAIITLMFAGLAAWFGLRAASVPFALLPAVLAIHFGINAVRVVAYARRAANAGPESAPEPAPRPPDTAVAKR